MDAVRAGELELDVAGAALHRLGGARRLGFRGGEQLEGLDRRRPGQFEPAVGPCPRAEHAVLEARQESADGDARRGASARVEDDALRERDPVLEHDGIGHERPRLSGLEHVASELHGREVLARRLTLDPELEDDVGACQRGKIERAVGPGRERPDFDRMLNARQPGLDLAIPRRGRIRERGATDDQSPRLATSSS